MSKYLSFTRKKSFRLLWFAIVVVVAAGQVAMYLRLKQQNQPLFRSTREMVLVGALIAVMLLGVLVKSRQSRGR